ncbi:MAG: polysaccharide deacetylase family protein [Bacteroidota bacterium]
MKVIKYHYIRPLTRTHFKGIKGLDVREFRDQLTYLKNNFTIIDHQLLHDHIQNNTQLPENAVLLTFDNGYSDMFRYVLPILVKENLKGLFYVPDYYAKGKHHLLDVNSIHVLLTKDLRIPQYVNEIELYMSANKDVLPQSFQALVNSYTFDSRFDTKEVQIIKKTLQFGLPEDHRKKLITYLLEKYVQIDHETLFEDFYCTTDQLNMMIDEGMHIGGHGLRHYWMGKMNEEEQEKEVLASKSFIQSLAAQKMLSFCYPFGSYNDTSIALLKKHGFEFAFTTEVKSYDGNPANRYIIPRYDTNDFPPITSNYLSR